ncbi:ATM interactor isoform X4 [Ctenopharyngodon idella]|uniref:ATM interactor isoform X4 n=1 Tax=Ctenopharyngodon idella TaxID=7959 RepID=UPI00222E81BC|nr:ATM interactor isoform X4 [Ctenopharyngodon idella]XP_051726984.1 ATM interactor isoform X4 [Ctenopharyngodon idella]XP_051726985.1 ATM interactor isoform X4 [Ctenopharyngodon idella]
MRHFMKMHAEKKHKCLKCSNGYSTEWDLRRHAEDCGRTYSCTCGCPYASRAALLSHIYRTGHEVPKEHRYPPVKKRKMERLSSSATNLMPDEQINEIPDSKKKLTEGAISTILVSEAPDSAQNNTDHPRNIQKLLLPKPKVALVNVPVMQFTHLPVLLPSAESSALRLLLLSVDAQGSVNTVHILSPSVGTVVPDLNNKTFKETFPVPTSGPETISTGVQVNLESQVSMGYPMIDLGPKNKSTSTNIQTDISYLNKGIDAGPATVSPCCEASVSSCSQTDISVSAQIQLPVSVQTQTLPSRIKATLSIGAQTDVFSFSSFNVTRETQTSCSAAPVHESQMDQEMCTNLFDTDTLSVSTQTATADAPFRTSGLEDPLTSAGAGLFEDKTVASMCFGAQTDVLQQNTVADNQTQTMILFRDLENILSDTITGAASSCASGLVAAHEPHHTGIDFDFEEFLNATHIQTQTEESGLNSLNTETTLELLDIETQTDFLLFDNLGNGHNSEVGTRVQPNDLELEMFDTQTQTDLNFLLDTSGHMPLGSILRQSSFSMSTESSDTETQTDIRPAPLSLPCSHDGQVRLSSAETQTISSSFHSLGHLFHTSNETQTAVDDFLSADLAWNMESHFSSVETQTCEELISLFRHNEKAKS